MAQKKLHIPKETLSLVIATCAVLISAASFYATYHQAQSEERQVKAATWPYLQVRHGNYDTDAEEYVVSITLKNAGVGPALVKSFSMRYRDPESDKETESDKMWEILAACCVEEDTPRNSASIGDVITSDVTNFILPADESNVVLRVKKTSNNGEFWDRLNDARWKITAGACYCSLLEECYATDFQSDPKLVKVCPSEL